MTQGQEPILILKLLFCIVPSFLHHASCSDRGSHSFIASYFLQCLSKLKYSFEFRFQFDLSNVVCVSLCFNCHSFLSAWMAKVLQLLNIFPTVMWERKDHLSWPSSEVITLSNASQDSINLYIFIYVFFSCYLLKIFCNILTIFWLIVWKCMDFVYLFEREVSGVSEDCGYQFPSKDLYDSSV